MSENRFVVRGPVRCSEPKIGRMVVVSVIVHLLIVGIAANKLFPEFKTKPRPVYYVDLKQKPVVSPRKVVPQQKKTVVQDTKKTEQSRVQKTEPKKDTFLPKKPIKPNQARSSTVQEPTQDFDVNEALIAALSSDSTKQPEPRDNSLSETKNERDRLRQQLEDLTSDEGSVETPIGSENGEGQEPGVDEQEWIEAYLKKMWRFSRYQIDETRIATIEATVELEYGPDGALKIYNFIDHSGDTLFDDSVRAAIIKGKQLSFNPGRNLKFIAHFNLKDLSK